MFKNEGGKVFKRQKKPRISQLIEITEEPVPVIEQDNSIRNGVSFVTGNFVLINMIPILMTHFFNVAEMVLAYSDEHANYKIKIRDLLNVKITNWKYNRPPDLIRCNKMASDIYKKKKPMDTMIYLSFNNETEEFEILDGSHRITALNIIKEANSMPLELLYPGQFGSNNDASWLYEQYLIVNIRFNCSEGELIDVFQNLNNALPVPELYTKKSNIKKIEKREMIETIVDDWMFRFKPHFTGTSRPITGNTTRDKFINLLDKIYDKYKIDTNDCNVLQELLNIANTKISTNIPSNASINSRVKCKKTGCYLFLQSIHDLETFI